MNIDDKLADALTDVMRKKRCITISSKPIDGGWEISIEHAEKQGDGLFLMMAVGSLLSSVYRMIRESPDLTMGLKIAASIIAAECRSRGIGFSELASFAADIAEAAAEGARHEKEA